METIELTAGDPQAGLIQEQLTGLIAASVLATFPSTLTEYLDRHDTRAAGATAAIRRAMHHIDEHLQEPVTLADIAAAARLSVRGLQDGFQRHLGTTPMRYLRKAWLDAARRDLVEADATRETVPAIARRWGFAHLGRFAVDYRNAFGESPSTTLRQ